MKLKKIITASICAAMMAVMTAAATVNAQTYTAWAASTTTQEPTAQSGQVILTASDVADDATFTVGINIIAKPAVAKAAVSVQYDTKQVMFVGSKQNSLVTGDVVETPSPGKYLYNFVNSKGTDFDGEFITLSFKLLDPTLSTVNIYVVDHTLEDTKLTPIDNTPKDAIVSVSEEAKAVLNNNMQLMDFPMSDTAYEMDKLGFSDVKNVTIKDENVLRYADGRFATVSEGTTVVEVEFNNGAIAFYSMSVSPSKITDDSSQAVVAITNQTAVANETSKENYKLGTSIVIIVAAVLTLILIIAEYFIIFKGDKKSSGKRKKDDEDEEYYDDDDYEYEDNADNSQQNDDNVQNEDGAGSQNMNDLVNSTLERIDQENNMKNNKND